MRLNEIVSGQRKMEISRLSLDEELSTEVQSQLIGVGLLDPPTDGFLAPNPTGPSPRS